VVSIAILGSEISIVSVIISTLLSTLLSITTLFGSVSRAADLSVIE
jgi:hypothetical protein